MEAMLFGYWPPLLCIKISDLCRNYFIFVFPFNFRIYLFQQNWDSVECRVRSIRMCLIGTAVPFQEPPVFTIFWSTRSPPDCSRHQSARCHLPRNIKLVSCCCFDQILLNLKRPDHVKFLEDDSWRIFLIQLEKNSLFLFIRALYNLVFL